jgi:hypothetical protein
VCGTILWEAARGCESSRMTILERTFDIISAIRAEGVT